MLGRRAVAVVVSIAALAGPSAAVAQDEVVVKSKSVVTQKARIKLSVVTIGAKVYVRSLRKGEQIDQARVRGAKAGDGSELLDFSYARFDEQGEQTKKRSARGQITVGWANPGGGGVTRYIGVTPTSLDPS
jgi:hypothetical protein